MLQTGILKKVKSNLMPGLGLKGQVFPTSRAEMSGLIGKTPSAGYIFNKTLNPIDTIGISVDLTSVGTTDITPGIFANTVQRQFTQGTTDSFDGNTTIFNDNGIDSFGFLLVLNLSQLPVADNMQILSKRQSATLFYQLTYRTSVARLQWQFINTTSATATLSNDHTKKGINGTQPIYVGVDRSGTDKIIAINLTDIAEKDTNLVVTNTGLFAIGSNTSTAPPFSIYSMYHFTGNNAENWSVNTLNNFWNGAKI